MPTLPTHARIVIIGGGAIGTSIAYHLGKLGSRQLGAKIGVRVPLQAAEHYYLLTEPLPGMLPDLPVDGISADFLRSHRWEIDVHDSRVPATPSLAPFYDPKSERVRA